MNASEGRDKAMLTSMIFGVQITRMSVEDIIDDFINDCAFNGVRVVHTLNVDHLVNLETNPTFKQAYDCSWINTIDGFPIHLLAKFKGLNVEKLSGSDIVPMVLHRLNPLRHRLFFLVPTEATGCLIAEKMRNRGFDDVRFIVPPFGFEHDRDYGTEICKAITEAGTTHLFLGVGAPKSEIWTFQHRQDLNGIYAFCVGAGLDYFSGRLRRAPAFMQSTGLEWMWRLMSDPRRLWRRYARGLFKFIALAIREFHR